MFWYLAVMWIGSRVVLVFNCGMGRFTWYFDV